MPATQQRRTVVQHLLDEPWRFDFFQAVRLLLAWLEEQGIAPERALIDHVLFENDLSLSFAPAQIAALDAGAGPLATEAGIAEALLADDALQIRITPAFMGLLGAGGTLPHHYTERIGGYLAATKDAAPRAFFDMFSNRAVAQFYTAWCKHRVEHAGGAGTDRFLPLLLGVAGFPPGAGSTDTATIADETIAQYAGVTVQRPVPPDVLSRILADYFDVPVALDESVGAWIGLHEQEQCAIGKRNAVLGYDTMLGDRSWRPDLHARIRIGPLSRTAFDGFLPHGERARALEQLLRLFGTPTVCYEIRLVLEAAAIQPVCLSGATPSARLGQDSFLVVGSEANDRSDMFYRITPLAPLPPLPVRAAPMCSPLRKPS
jgi:type VI secretion system protein ImpH